MRISIVTLFFALISIFIHREVYAYDPVACIDQISLSDTEITVGLAAKVCANAWTPATATCYINVSLVDKEIIRSIAIDLCTGSVDSEKTIQCYAKAASRYNRGIATSLCGARKQEKQF